MVSALSTLSYNFFGIIFYLGILNQYFSKVPFLASRRKSKHSLSRHIQSVTKKITELDHIASMRVCRSLVELSEGHRRIWSLKLFFAFRRGRGFGFLIWLTEYIRTLTK